jgi:uncharacterized repeat protein (TIGR04076 family)
MRDKMKKDVFELYDLEVSVTSIDGNCTCKMSIGDKLFLKGGKISFPSEQSFCLYALQSVIPLLPIKQRKNHPADWIETDSEVTCPDPACKLIMEIKRKELSEFKHNDVSSIPLK